jgi:hypothetical protein
MRTRVQEPLLKPELNNELGATERRKTHTAPSAVDCNRAECWLCVCVACKSGGGRVETRVAREDYSRRQTNGEDEIVCIRHCIALITRHIRHPLFVGMQLDDQFAFVSATPLNARWIWMDGSVNLLGRCCVYCMARRSYLCALCISSVMHWVPNQSWAGHFSLFARTTYCTL